MTELSKPTPIHTDDMNDAAWRSVEADMAAGLCWACGCKEASGEPHSPYCPEQEAARD
jgi:hypothetical protein